MSNVSIFKPNQTPQYLRSVNTPEYSSDPDVLVDPDITSVQNIPLRYWKRTGDTVVEMSLAEKNVVDTAELQARKSLADNLEVEGMKTVLTALIKVLNTKLPANKQITKQEMVDALKGEIV